MKPDKPGFWWWEDTNGRFHVIAFDDHMETPDVMFLHGYSGFVDPEQLEKSPNFLRWVGLAHPPKRLRRYYPTTERYAVETVASMTPHPRGGWVRYTDVSMYDTMAKDDYETR